ncbi:MAG: nucleotide exchange factor GrpE [Kiritimatiellaeota bacterium]|nr:nucleotide exchange factor GrpE [Kiritimatiellota bacterium]
MMANQSEEKGRASREAVSREPQNAQEVDAGEQDAAVKVDSAGGRSTRKSRSKGGGKAMKAQRDLSQQVKVLGPQVQELGVKLKELGAQLEEFKDRYLRSRAELDNYRKRVAREFQAVRQASTTAVIEEFLRVFDHFEMAMAHADKTSDINVLKQGMDMILAEFCKAFETLGVERIEAEGMEFDPRFHEAVAQEPSTEVPSGRVLKQWKCGFRLGDRLLRPASVVVSSGPPDRREEG